MKNFFERTSFKYFTGSYGELAHTIDKKLEKKMKGNGSFQNKRNSGFN